MKWKTCFGVFSVIATLSLMMGCGGAPAASQAYRYGDMFAAGAEESYSGGGSMDRGAPPPAPAPAVRARSAPPAEPIADMEVAESASFGRSTVTVEADMGEGEAYADEMDTSDDGATARPQAFRAEPPEEAPEPEPQNAPEQPDTEPGQASTPSEPGQGQGQEEPTRQAPLMIYRAELRLAVQDVQAKIDEVLAYAHEIGGYVLRQDDTSVVIRVPARRFRGSLERIEGLGDLLQRNVSAQDVSDQVRDLRIRLRNAIQMRDRLAELLERAQTVPESLAIERELERLTEMIELMRGQLASFEERIAFSTITVRFQPVRDESEVPRERFHLPFPWLDQIGLPRLMQL